MDDDLLEMDTVVRMREVVQSESLGKRFDMESVVTFMHEVEGVRPAMQRPAQTLQLRH